MLGAGTLRILVRTSLRATVIDAAGDFQSSARVERGDFAVDGRGNLAGARGIGPAAFVINGRRCDQTTTLSAT